MKHYTFNKENWTGEEATICVKDNCFEFNGYSFELEARTYTYDFDGQSITDFVVHSDDWPAPIFTVKSDCEGGYYCENNGIERQGKNPFILAAQMAANTI